MASPAAVRRGVVTPLATPRARNSLEAALRTLCLFVAARAPLGPGFEVPLSPVATMPSADVDASSAATPLSFSMTVVAATDDSDCTVLASVAEQRPLVVSPSGSSAASFYSDRSVVPATRELHLCRSTFPVAAMKIKRFAYTNSLLVVQSDGGGRDCYMLIPEAMETRLPASSPSRSLPVASYPGYRSSSHSNRKPGFHLYRSTFPIGTPKRASCLSPVIISGKRHYTNWCWTPWERTRPKDTPKPQVDAAEIAKFISKLDVDSEDGVKLKTMLLEKFYSGTAKGESIDLKLDLILHRQEVTNQLLKNLSAAVKKEKPKWGTFVIFGKRIDLSSILAVIGLL